VFRTGCFELGEAARQAPGAVKTNRFADQKMMNFWSGELKKPVGREFKRRTRGVFLLGNLTVPTTSVNFDFSGLFPSFVPSLVPFFGW